MTWEPVLTLILRSGLRIATNQDKQLSQPTSRMNIYSATSEKPCITLRLRRSDGRYKHLPWTPTLPFLLIGFKVAKFERRRKRLVNVFYNMSTHPSPTWGR